MGAAGAGVDHADVTAFVTVDGDVFRLMRVAEEENVHFFLDGVVGGELVLRFDEEFVTVREEKTDTSGVHDFFRFEKFPLAVGEEKFVAVSADRVIWNVRELFHNGVCVVQTVAEKEDAVNGTVLQVRADGIGHADRVAVDVGKNQDFHKILQKRKWKVGCQKYGGANILEMNNQRRAEDDAEQGTDR